MKDMPEFYDHVEEEIEAEMKYLNRLYSSKPTEESNGWVRFPLKWTGFPTITDAITGQKAIASYAEYRVVGNNMEYRIHYKVEDDTNET